ncbi:unnamed protein product [Urochloa humidicola]
MAPSTPPPDGTTTDDARTAAMAEAAQLAAQLEKERQALADAADAAAQAASAANDRVRAAADALERERRAAADLQRAAEEARHRADPPKADDNVLPPDDADFEAAVIANLHAQAAGVQNIRTLVPIVLDTDSAHYDRWRDLVLLVLERYALSSHVLDDANHPDAPAWRRMDAVVLSWLFGAVTTTLMETLRTRGGTARTAWLGIEAQFLGNREFRALQLDAKFRVFTQGDLSIGDYCSKMKSMAERLGDLGEEVHDRTLVLNVLRGLNERFQHMRIHFRRSNPFPCFRDVPPDSVAISQDGCCLDLLLYIVPYTLGIIMQSNLRDYFAINYDYI